jgi:hypothetical protein
MGNDIYVKLVERMNLNVVKHPPKQLLDCLICLKATDSHHRHSQRGTFLGMDPIEYGGNMHVRPH